MLIPSTLFTTLNRLTMQEEVLKAERDRLQRVRDVLARLATRRYEYIKDRYGKALADSLRNYLTQNRFVLVVIKDDTAEVHVI